MKKIIFKRHPSKHCKVIVINLDRSYLNNSGIPYQFDLGKFGINFLTSKEKVIDFTATNEENSKVNGDCVTVFITIFDQIGPMNLDQKQNAKYPWQYSF